MNLRAIFIIAICIFTCIILFSCNRTGSYNSDISSRVSLNNNLSNSSKVSNIGSMDLSRVSSKNSSSETLTSHQNSSSAVISQSVNHSSYINNQQVQITSFFIYPKSIEITIGDEIKLYAVATPTNAPRNKITFVSSNEEIAFVKELSGYGDCKVIGKSVGTCIITVKTPNGLQKECNVTVK